MSVIERKPALLRVGTGNNTEQHVSYSQVRQPRLYYPGNGYGYGEISGSFWASDIEVRVLDQGLSLGFSGDKMGGSCGIVLGPQRNQVDICMWGVQSDTAVESDVLEASQIQDETGLFEHRRTGEFDRRIIVPILAGTLSLHLATQEWQPQTRSVDDVVNATA